VAAWVDTAMQINAKTKQGDNGKAEAEREGVEGENNSSSGSSRGGGGVGGYIQSAMSSFWG